MGKTKNTIKINDQLYDATTGEPVKHGRATATKLPQKSVDGFIITPVARAQSSHITTISTKPVVNKPSMKDVVRSPKTSIGHTIQHSHTLMRQSVKKPKHAKRHLVANGHTDKLVQQPKLSVSTKASVDRLNKKRLEHAKQISKSEHISRFGDLSATSRQNKPVKYNPQATAKLKPVAPTGKKPQSNSDMLHYAVEHATSHKQPAPKKQLSHRQRMASYSALAAIATIVLGFVVFQNLPGFQVRIASAKAGFAASLPSYRPSGYHFGQLDYGAGVVAMHFKSNSDESRKFAITQKSSAWDSDTLRDLFVQANDKNYRAIQDGGLTIYLYGQNNATWVNHGVWYRVQATGSLSNRQLIDIAKSL